MSKPRKPQADWEAIERLYRAGMLSIREIAKQQGISHTAIQQRAKREMWARDMTKRIRNLAAAKVAEAVATGNPATEAEIVERAADTVVALVREHRHDLRTGRSIAQKLMVQLDESLTRREEIEDTIREETADAENPAASKEARSAAWEKRARMLRAVSLPGHAGVLRDLTNSLRGLIPLERQAFNVDEAPPPDTPPDQGRPSGLDAAMERIKKYFPDEPAPDAA